MNIKRSILSTFIDMLKDIWIHSSISNRFLILGFIANIPSPIIFLAYVTQAITMISLGIYLYFHPKIEAKLQPTSFLNRTVVGLPLPTFILVAIAIMLQLFWIPFITQLLTIALIVFILILSRKYYL